MEKEVKRLNSVEQILLADLERNKEVQEGLKRELYETTIAVANAQADCAAEKQRGVELSNQIIRLTDWREEAEAKVERPSGRPRRGEVRHDEGERRRHQVAKRGRRVDDGARAELGAIADEGDVRREADPGADCDDVAVQRRPAAGAEMGM